MEAELLVSIAAGTAAMLGYGVSDLFGSILSKKEDPIRLNLWYFALSTVILAIVAVLFYKPLALNSYKAAILAFTSIFSVLGLVFFIKGLRAGKLSIVMPIASTYSIIPIAIGVLFLAEAPTGIQYAGIAFAVIGTAITSMDFHKLSIHSGMLLPGVGYGILTMLMWGFFYAGIGVLSKSMGWLYPVLISTAASAAILLIFSIIKNRNIALPRRSGKTIILWVLLGTAALVSYGFGTEYGSMPLVSPITASAVIVSVLLGITILKEKLKRNQLVGIGLIIAGIAMIAI
ncbi:MAG: DMT family transporter [Candidatus Micrarchaeaceae archaeon]